MKRCNKCKQEKPLQDYHKLKTAKDGHKGYCKECGRRDTKQWQQNNLDKVVMQGRKYRSENLEQSRENSRNYYSRNKEAAIAYKIRYNHTRRMSDPLFALSETLRSQISEAFKRRGCNKLTKTEDILGCSFAEFKTYIESLFESWMTWDNKGLYDGTPNVGWDIDHIIPISSAQSVADIIKLNHFTNLRPLCSYTNRDVKKNNLDF